MATKWQLAYLKKEEAYSSDSGTIFVDLPSDEQISMLMVEFQCYNTSPTSRDDDRSVLDVVKDVHVLLEGSKSAYHVKPEVGSYLSFIGSGQLPLHNLRERGAQNMRLPIYFGRYPGDPDYLLDTRPYSSAQLQIEYELNTTYETSGTAVLTVWFLRPLDRLAPAGFVRSRIVNTFTSSGSAETKSIDLPTGLPWLNVGFRVFDFDYYPTGNVTDVDFDVDEGRLHLFDGGSGQLMTLNTEWYHQPLWGHRYWAMPVSGNNVQTFMGDAETIQWSQGGANLVIFNSSAIWGPSYAITMRDNDGTAISTATDIFSTPLGSLPYQCFTLGNFADDPFPAPSHADAKVVFELSAHAALVETFVQEVVAGTL